MISDDLSGLFGKGQPGVRFRQGTVLTWNPNTGENTIDLAGGTLTDVPILNTGEAIALKASAVVILMGLGLSWFIVGRVTPPNDPSFASASVAFASGKDFQQGFAIAAGDQTQASVTLDVPAWADEAAVMGIAACTFVNDHTVREAAVLYCKINGSSSGSGGMETGLPASTDFLPIASITTAHAEVITSPGPTITVTAVTSPAVAFAANGINTATVNALAIFRSTV